MRAPGQETEALLTPAEVAAMFRVDPKTVARWAKSGKLTAVRTLGGHRRYVAAEVRALRESALTAVSVDGAAPADGAAADGGAPPAGDGPEVP